MHHVVGIAAVSLLLQLRDGMRILPGLMLIELSTIPLNLSWLMRELGAKRTITYQLTMMIFVLLFTLLRVVWFGIFLLTLIVKMPKFWTSLGMLRPLAVTGYILQLYWFKKILQLLRRIRGV
jgi:hypothetical protein